MAAMKRRAFLQSSLMAAGAMAFARGGLAQMASPSDSSAVRVGLSVDGSALGHTIGADYTGLSYEQAQMANPNYFSGTNTQLAGFLRTLGSQGVLRIGGNTSEYTFWSRHAKPTAADEHLEAGPDKGHHAPAREVITPEAVRNLSEFLDKTGWKLIYGLNLGKGTPENAADEAAYVMETIGADRILAFQLGNEPDLFNRNGLRPKDWTVQDYLADWERFFRVIHKRVPDAPFAGPDTAGNVKWLMPFAEKFKGDVKFISSHYYAEGPPTDPAMTIARLMRPNPRLEGEIAAVHQAEQATGLRFRLTETNSCYQGGKQGVSDTFAAALWAGDLMYQMAAAGSMGINFHGGGYGWYTPVAGTPEDGFVARPEYYGMLLFAQAGAGQLVSAKLSGNSVAPLLTAYALRGTDGRTRVALFNKNLDADVEVAISGVAAPSATVLRLEAPRPDDTTDVTFGGAPVGASGSWSALVREHVAGRDGRHVLHMRRASGALLEFA
jgi:hypothetical protein